MTEQTQPDTPEASHTPDTKDNISSKEDFAAMLDESFGAQPGLVGSVVKGTVIAIENDMAVIDVGLKAEGRVSMEEFAAPGQATEISVGDIVDVYLDRMENAQGEAVISRERALREEAWTKLEEAFNKTEKVEGVIFGRVKGGFTVDLSGAVAFLPGSQVDVRPVRDITPLLGLPQWFQVLKMDRRRGNIVVSRRAVLEETRAEQRSELIASLEEGQIREGVVKNITDFGAFVDLGGIDGLLHVTDMSWRRISHPSEALSVGETVKIQIIKVNPETQRISLGMKQLEADPWDGVETKYPIGVKYKGRVTNITDYGAFVELEPGVEGLVHVSEMSWTKKNIHPGKIVSTSQEVEVMVLDVGAVKRRISLGLKQCMANPWETFAENYSVGSEIEGEVRNITEFGLFIGLEGNVDGMAHMSDLDWNKPADEAIKGYKKGDVVKAVVLDIDANKGRIGLGIKQLQDDPFAAISKLKRGAVVTCTVVDRNDGGIEVKFGDAGFKSFIRRGDLARDRSEQRPDRFNIGDKVDARIISVDRSGRRVTLSIKARELADEKEAVAQYGSADSGASLGDILGAAMSRARADKEDTDTASGEDKAESTAEKVEKPESTETKEAKPAAKKKAAPKKTAAAKTAKDKEAARKSDTKAAETKKEKTAKSDKKPAAKKAAVKKTATKKSTDKTAAKKKAAPKKAKGDEAKED